MDHKMLVSMSGKPDSTKNVGPMDSLHRRSPDRHPPRLVEVANNENAQLAVRTGRILEAAHQSYPLRRNHRALQAPTTFMDLTETRANRKWSALGLARS